MQRRSTGIVAAVVLAAVAACAEPTQPTAPVEVPQFARAGGKFTFPAVTFPDGTTGIIEADTKATNKGTFTKCSYFAPDYGTFLGGFGDDSLDAGSVDDAAAVLDHCLSHYADRS